jgi:uncharacterized repeat protein (TIGR01451 family)
MRGKLISILIPVLLISNVFSPLVQLGGQIALSSNGTPEITVEKTANVTIANPGDLIEYTIYYNNTGTHEANTVWINDNLPDGITYVTSNAEANKTGDYNWTFNNVKGTADPIWYGPYLPTPRPPKGTSVSMAYDSTNNKVVLFGGTGCKDETWEYDTASHTWYGPYKPTPRPSARRNFAMDYDSTNNKVVLFGGRNLPAGDRNNETWEYDTATHTWAGPFTPSHRPSARQFHAMTFDSENDRIVMFGGYIHPYDLYDDETWEYDSSTHTWYGPFMPTPHPIERYGHGMAYDSANDKVILFGGSRKSTYKNDIWEYDTATHTWAGPYLPSYRPSGRIQVDIAYNSALDRIVMFGGWDMSFPDGTWEYDTTNRTWYGPYVPSPHPGGRHGNELVYDSVNNRIVTSCGGNKTDLLDDTWEYASSSSQKTNYLTITVKVNSDVPNGTILTNTVTLEYTDSSGSPMPGSTATVDVLIISDEPNPPVANAGSDQSVNEGDLVEFDGSGSYQNGGTIVSYEWDFDSNVDSDSDGNYTNDVDAIGVTPTHIYGDNGVYEATLTVKSPGEGGESVKIDQDAVFCADTSGSMTSEAIDFMKEGLAIYADEMEYPDQGAVVVFGSSVWLMNPLTDDYNQLKNDIANIPEPYGSTPMGEATQVAIDELLLNGNQGHIQVIILLTDGQWNGLIDPITQANRAATENITIFTIGLEPAFGTLDEFTLMQIALITDGEYFYAPDASYLQDIYKEIAQIVKYPGGPPLQDTDTVQVTVNNIDPAINSISITSANVGSPVTITAEITDPGSDDLKFLWDWGDATCVTTWTYYNNGVSDDPYPSPEINPVDMSSGAAHIYLHGGNYTVSFFVIDDDGGSSQEIIYIYVLDPLKCEFTWSPDPQDEGDPIQFTDISIFNTNGTIFWMWGFAGLGSSTSQNPQFTFMDDGIYPVTLTIINQDGTTDSAIHNITISDLAPTAEFTWSPDPQLECSIVQFSDLSTSYPDEIIGWHWDFGDGTTSSQQNTSYVYGDDGVYLVTLTVVDEDNSTDSVAYNVNIMNVNPTVTISSVVMDVEIGLRVAGRKYNNVSMTLYEEGVPFDYVIIERKPGSPNEQMTWVPKVLDMTKTYSAILHYIPVDPPYLGANPVWIYIKFPNGSIQKIHHTFNVQQSKERDSNHWNHVEPWEVNLNAHLVGWEFEVDYQVTDPGSDDEILTFSYGSQNVEVTHLCNPPNFDPYPSPEVHPMNIYGTTKLVYEGLRTLTLVARDDDNIRIGFGEGSYSIDVGY